MTNLLSERWKEPLETIQDKIGSFLNRWKPKGTPSGGPETITSDSMPAFIQTGGPRMDMMETSDGLMVTAEVPGINKDDMTIEVVGNRLTLRGEKKSCREMNKGNIYQSECRYGGFTRIMQLPYTVDEQNIRASLQKGILTIRLARSPDKKSTGYRIPIS